MIIRYKFNDESVSEVEVSEEIGAVIIESRRREENYNRKERYHCYSLDAITYEGAEYADRDTPESILDEGQRNERLYSAMKQLTETQRRRLLMLASGLSYREIARREGVSDHKKIIKSVEGARKKIQKLI